MMEFETAENYHTGSSSSFDQSKVPSHFKQRVRVRRKGDKIYYIKDANINMPTKLIKEDNVQVEQEQSVTDEHSSNTESSFKTFSFEEQSNTGETEKCIEFWKTVMEKKLEPVKAYIITKDANVEENNKRLESLQEKFLEQSNEAGEQAYDDYRNLWKGIIEKIQRAKLDDIKMNVKARCQICNSVENLIQTPKDNVRNKEEKRSIEDLKIEKAIHSKEKLLPQVKRDMREKQDEHIFLLSEEQQEQLICTTEAVVSGEEETEITVSEESVPKTSDDEICIAPKSSLLSDFQEESLDMVENAESPSSKSKITINRQVSMMLPTGKIEVIEKDSQTDLSWDMPIRDPVYHEYRKIRSSVDILMDKRKKESSLLLAHQHQTVKKDGSQKFTKRSPVSKTKIINRKLKDSSDGKISDAKLDITTTASLEQTKFSHKLSRAKLH